MKKNNATMFQYFFSKVHHIILYFPVSFFSNSISFLNQENAIELQSLVYKLMILYELNAPITIKLYKEDNKKIYFLRTSK